jgi:hypothetical protein
MNQFSKNQRVTIYYNDLTLGYKSSGHRIHENCPSVDVPWKQANEYAEKKISNKEWSVYLIPEFNSIACYHEGQDPVDEQKTLQCPNGCSKEAYDDEKPEGTGMFTPIYLNGLSSPPEHICIICGEDGEIV